jgi:hypothetical protein
MAWTRVLRAPVSTTEYVVIEIAQAAANKPNGDGCRK